MKVLLINGSPHKQGCTYTALSEVASSLNEEGIETDFYWIGNKPIGGCVGCFAYIVIEREGFYSLESNETGAQKYRYLVTIVESPIGIVCWKHLDWPTPQN